MLFNWKRKSLGSTVPASLMPCSLRLSLPAWRPKSPQIYVPIPCLTSVISYPLPSWCLTLGLKSILGSGWKQSSLYSTPHPISIPPSDPPYTKKYSKQNKRIIVLLIIILLSIVYIYEWRKLNTFTFRVCELLLSRKTNGDLKRFQPIVEGREGGGGEWRIFWGNSNFSPPCFAII